MTRHVGEEQVEPGGGEPDLAKSNPMGSLVFFIHHDYKTFHLHMQEKAFFMEHSMNLRKSGENYEMFDQGYDLWNSG